ncbi:hypothetical protein BC567DRAFT_221177 [Phyllosticta citribraziliensis]
MVSRQHASLTQVCYSQQHRRVDGLDQQYLYSIRIGQVLATGLSHEAQPGGPRIWPPSSWHIADL